MKFQTVNKTKMLLFVTVIYFIFTTIVFFVKYLNRNKIKNKSINICINVIQHVCHYLFPIIMIICGAITLIDNGAKTWLIVFCVVAIVIRFSIDIYKMDRKSKNNKEFQENVTKSITYTIDVDHLTFDYLIKND